jgi:hypothetical protein
VNASEQANSLELASKIATVVNLFKSAFPDMRADLKPWMNDPQSQGFIDPDSIDIGLHLPGWSRRFQCRSILVQIRFYTDPIHQTHRAIGLELAGFNHIGTQWQLSTVGNWAFKGMTEPTAEVAAQLKDICQRTLELFNNNDPQAIE